ncbi:MAG: hypothetical protein QW738_07560 [Nitrososphaeria archaeon]
MEELTKLKAKMSGGKDIDETIKKEYNPRYNRALENVSYALQK